jgi:ABC-type uncharacterized transport system auxiliary subunit
MNKILQSLKDRIITGVYGTENKFSAMVKANTINPSKYALLLAYLLCVSGLTACVTLRSEYPKTTFYRLEQKAVQAASTTVAEGLLVKPFSIDSEFDTDHIITLVSATETQPLHYHRWISDPQELLTAYLTNRIEQSKLFAKGVFTPSSSVVPMYQLEGRISECLARTSTAQPANTALLTIHLTLQRLDEKGQQTVLLQKVYSQTVQRSSDAASNIALAMSDAASLVCDELLKDVAALLK